MGTRDNSADGPAPNEKGGRSARLLYTIREAAEALSIGRSKLYELLNSGQIESIHIDTAHRIPTSAITDFIARRRTDSSSEDGPERGSS